MSKRKNDLAYLKAHANEGNRFHGPKSLTGFKLYAISANIVVFPCKRKQQVTTLLGPTMLGPFAWALKAHANDKVGSCWELLALVAWCMQTNATTANIVGVRSLF